MSNRKVVDGILFPQCLLRKDNEKSFAASAYYKNLQGYKTEAQMRFCFAFLKREK
jgi:hypothetical protein